jgi:hypothetical protein
MRKRRVARRSRRMGRKPEEQAQLAGQAPAERERSGPYYAAGPALSLNQGERAPHAAATAEQGLAPLPSVQGTGAPRRETAHGGSVRLEGRTDADFGGSSFRTAGVNVARATGCQGCPDSDCVRATGTLVSTFRVRTSVTLPSVDDFPNLTACQRRRVRDAISNVLAPHEQEHVRAFRTYNGTTRTPFDLTLCRADFDSAIREMFDAADQTRQDAARAASAALDPFHFDVDLDCEEPAPRAATSGTAAPPAHLEAPVPDHEDR